MAFRTLLVAVLLSQDALAKVYKGTHDDIVEITTKNKHFFRPVICNRHLFLGVPCHPQTHGNNLSWQVA